MRAATRERMMRERMISITARGWPGGWIVGYTEAITKLSVLGPAGVAESTTRNQPTS